MIKGAGCSGIFAGFIGVGGATCCCSSEDDEVWRGETIFGLFMLGLPLVGVAVGRFDSECSRDFTGDIVVDAFDIFLGVLGDFIWELTGGGGGGGGDT